jgi:DNA-binding response OmpR family regulator
MADILVVEDELVVRKVVVKYLESEGHQVASVGTVKAGLKLLESNRVFHLLVLDRKLPDGDGLEVCLKLKRDPRTRIIPVIILTSIQDFDQELKSYKDGADLFLHKPVDRKKLLKYVAALVKRTPYRGEVSDKLAVGEVLLDPKQRSLNFKGKTVENIPQRLFALLYLIASRSGRTVPRSILVQKLWGNTVRDKQVDITVSRLRTLLGPELKGLVRSMRGGGYMFDANLKDSGKD